MKVRSYIAVTLACIMILLTLLSKQVLADPIIDMMFFEEVTYNEKYGNHVYMETAVFNKHNETKSRFVNKTPIDLLCVVKGGKGRFYKSETGNETELLPIVVEFPVYGNRTSRMEYTGVKQKEKLTYDCMPLNGSDRGKMPSDLMQI